MRNMRLLALLLAAVLVRCCEHCQDAIGGTLHEEDRRFRGARITKQQWQTFFDEMRYKRDAMVVQEASVTRVFVSRETAVYVFTAKSHPAHPAAVRRALVSHQGKLYVHT